METSAGPSCSRNAKRSAAQSGTSSSTKVPVNQDCLASGKTGSDCAAWDSSSSLLILLGFGHVPGPPGRGLSAFAAALGCGTATLPERSLHHVDQFADSIRLLQIS